jgi:hypothetical protein
MLFSIFIDFDLSKFCEAGTTTPFERIFNLKFGSLQNTEKCQGSSRIGVDNEKSTFK